MKESMWAAAIVVAGIIGLGLIMLFVNLTINDQDDYYLLKEVTEASMYDAIDIDYYRYSGEFRIARERFVESFIRRWSVTASRGQDVTIDIVDVIEMPPKVTVSVSTKTQKYNFTSDMTNGTGQYDIINKIDGVLETIY